MFLCELLKPGWVENEYILFGWIVPLTVLQNSYILSWGRTDWHYFNLFKSLVTCSAYLELEIILGFQFKIWPAGGGKEKMWEHGRRNIAYCDWTKPLEEKHSSVSSCILWLSQRKHTPALCNQHIKHLDCIKLHKRRPSFSHPMRGLSKGESDWSKGTDLDLLMERLSFFSNCLMWLIQELWLAAVFLCSDSLRVLACSASITWNNQQGVIITANTHFDYLHFTRQMSPITVN